MTSIDALKIGDKARVVGFNELSASFWMRLYGLGFHKGAEFTLMHVAPLGCPIAVQVGQTLLSLRKEEIKQVQLEKI